MNLENEEVKIDIIRYSTEGLSSYKIAEKMGIPRSTIGHFLAKKTYKKWWKKLGKKSITGELYDHYKNILILNKKRYILTSAQNNTFVHEDFLLALENMARHIDAQIIVGTYTYNKCGFQNLEKNNQEWFDPKIKQYILNKPAQLADGLVWCGELNILPTAVNPLSGLHSYNKNNSGIIPHAKICLESIPTHKKEHCRMLYTTGSITKRNYIQKKTGQKASFHHCFSALLVEVDDDGNWFVRQLHADEKNGSFQDLSTIYTKDSVLENKRVEAINWGDIHIEKMDTSVANCSFYGDDSMLSVLKPKYQFLHDVCDFTAKNHHNIKDPYHQFKTYINGENSVEENINDVIKFIRNIKRHGCLTIVVESNHDLALMRWLKESDYKHDPVNAIFYLSCQLEIYKAIQNHDDRFSILEYLCNKDLDIANAIFLRIDDTFKICNEKGDGIECGSHGHKGNNGARGSALSHAKLESKYNIGHSHSATIKDGVYVAGVCADFEKMDYAKGPSSWSHSHIVTYSNGKRTIITIKKGKWKG